MKLANIALGALLCAALAACGGNSGVTPSPAPTTRPTQYTSYLRFVGAMAGRSVQGDIRHAQSVTLDSGTATPIPIMVISPPESGIDTSVYGGDIQAVVSPYPSASPSVTITQTNPGAAIWTPTPVAGVTPSPLPSGVVAQVNVGGANVVQTQSTGTASASIGDPINENPTAPVYSYMSVALDCYAGPSFLVAAGSANPYTAHFGWKWSGTSWVADDNVADADIYVDGPNCVAKNPSESQTTIHVPGGDTRLSTDTPFYNVSATQWVNDETAFAIPATTNPDGSWQLLVIGKTRDSAHIFKIWPNHPADGMFGAVEVSGDSVDGF